MPINETDLDQLLTKSDAKTELNVSMRTLERMIANREIEVVRVGSGAGRIRITKRAILDCLNRKVVPPVKPRPAR